MGGLGGSVEIPHGEHSDLKADPRAAAFMCAAAVGICLCVLYYKRGRDGITSPAASMSRVIVSNLTGLKLC